MKNAEQELNYLEFLRRHYDGQLQFLRKMGCTFNHPEVVKYRLAAEKISNQYKELMNVN